MDPLVDLVETQGVRLLLVSVLMLPSALKIKDLTTRFKEKNLDVKVVVGGAPFRFDPQLWKEVGADAMGDTASGAVAIINRVMGEKR